VSASVPLPGSRTPPNTVRKLWREIGEACIRYQDETFRNSTCKRFQIDEIWSFVYAKAKNVPAEMKGKFGVGDVWTFTAIDADSKLMPSFLVGRGMPPGAPRSSFRISPAVC
jgi:hypothetical protein